MSFLSWLFGRKTKVKIDWLEIESRQQMVVSMSLQGNQIAIKQAVIDYDKLIDHIMKQFLPGNTFGERLKSIKNKMPKQIYHKLWQAHIKRNELVHDHGSFITDWEVKTYMATYQEAVSALRGLSLR